MYGLSRPDVGVQIHAGVASNPFHLAQQIHLRLDSTLHELTGQYEPVSSIVASSAEDRDLPVG